MVWTLAFLVAIAIIGSVSGHSKCTPDQWEGVIGVSALCKGLHRAYAKTAYDATKSRTASVWTSTESSEKIRVVTQFKQGNGARYYIRGNECCKITVRGDFKKFCVPDGATDVGSFYYGLGDNKLTCETYLLKIDGKAIALAMTSDNIPVNYAIKVTSTAENGHPGFSAVAEFMDITAGIADATVFDLPDTCSDGCGREEALMYLLQGDSALLLVNPFEVENMPLPALRPLNSLQSDIQTNEEKQRPKSTLGAEVLRDARLKFMSRIK